MSTSVKFFTSAMAGAPSLTNAVGTLIAVFDGCLVNGFGSVTLDSLVVSGGIATATYSSGHGFIDYGETGPVILISGATPSGLNGEHRVTVTSSTEFTFTTTESDQTASGTITAKMAPGGWTKAFSGTNKAAYLITNSSCAAHYLRVDDSVGGNARVVGYESMSDVDTGSYPFPTAAQVSGGLYVYKSNSASARTWTLVCDDGFFLLMCDAGGLGYANGGVMFGGIVPHNGVDVNNTILVGGSSSTNTTTYGLGGSSGTGAYMVRNYADVTGAVSAPRHSHSKTTAIGSPGENYPSLVDGGVGIWPIMVWDDTAERGYLPGVYNPLSASIPQYEALENTPQLPNRTLVAVLHGNGAGRSTVVDITGPWR